MTERPRPVLYLDFNGVIDFFGGRGSYGKRSGLGYARHSSVHSTTEPSPGWYSFQWSAELLRKLDALEGLDIIWVSAWRQETALLENAMRWHKPSGFLEWGDPVRDLSDSVEKLNAILADQAENPRPFIWADDEATTWYDQMREKGTLPALEPHLVIAPDSKTGLTSSDLVAISNFVTAHTFTEAGNAGHLEG